MAADDKSTDSGPPVNFSMTYNDDNIDNTSEKPIDYSRRYQEAPNYEQSSVALPPNHGQSPPRMLSVDDLIASVLTLPSADRSRATRRHDAHGHEFSTAWLRQRTAGQFVPSHQSVRPAADECWGPARPRLPLH